MKTGEDLYCKVQQSPRLPRVVLMLDSQCGRQGPPNPESRTSTDHQSERSTKYEETCRGNFDYRIQGIPDSIVQKEDSNRKEIENRLIQQFETHPNREVANKGFEQDLRNSSRSRMSRRG